MHSRIEQIASQKLQMQVPDAKRVQVVSPDDLQLSAQENQPNGVTP
jgi:cell division protein FtsL